MSMIVQLDHVSRFYKTVIGVGDINLELPVGAYGLVGPNGSGKSTFFNLVSGVYTPDSGSVHFAGQDVTKWEAHDIARLGLARTFQLLRIFGEMTVLENVQIGHHCHVDYGAFSAVFGTRQVAAEEKLEQAVHRMQHRLEQLKEAKQMQSETKERVESLRSSNASMRR